MAQEQETDAPNAEKKDDHSHLRELNAQKESLFSQRNAVSQKIRALIGQIKAKKSDRNLLTDSVKAQKEDRAKLSKEIRDKIDVIKALKEKLPKQAPSPAFKGPRESPGRLRAQIEELNRKIETEAPSFEKEQKFMKMIKELKRQLDETEKRDEGSSEVRALSKEIDALKAKADSAHDEVQEKAKQSQALHEQILVWSKEVDELKKQEESLQSQFLTSKKEHDDLAVKLGEMRVEREHKARDGQQRQEAQEQARQKKRLSQRIEEVQEKIKKGEKLTTEDLIILQGSEE
ncbi:MAG: hypothetical protein AABX47_05845 [Nanoarchaeota archaeon]